jgi:protein SCO1/2
MNRMFPALAALLAFAPLSGCGQAPQEPPLAGARIGGPFALTDQNGKTVRDTDFAGKYRIVYFGYTYCPDVCPTDMQKIGQASIQ